VARQRRLQTAWPPRAATTKEAIKLRLNADGLTALHAGGDGWQMMCT